MWKRLKVIDLHTNPESLLPLLKKGDRSAQQLLYKKYAPVLLGICRSYVSDIHHAEDVMISAFCKIFQKLEDYRGDGSFEGWMRRIAVRESLDHLRKRSLCDFPGEEWVERYQDATDWEEESEWDADSLQQLIDELPEGYRVVFLMWAVEGYTHKEIAQTLGISENTSKSQLFKARQRLQASMKPLKEQEHGT